MRTVTVCVEKSCTAPVRESAIPEQGAPNVEAVRPSLARSRGARRHSARIDRAPPPAWSRVRTEPRNGAGSIRGRKGKPWVVPPAGICATPGGRRPGRMAAASSRQLRWASSRRNARPAKRKGAGRKDPPPCRVPLHAARHGRASATGPWPPFRAATSPPPSPPGRRRPA